ncbi:DUF3078 domain-containing protein [Solitalea canadensis]|uniref:DUF3078 domain-containing protein n=1 Tax=Solitalea canadensis (strain ATCC 29591 / DSM 3403 / JCM 21819 / LMG 8368 / NBRC 15130 / NCIMB 12057 / USAM 9D) TaxID=929556 RepID=H8KRM3_SOLCM|nr:DUF3078 domain-containing protein [Solitalea canadensis]AFD07604.1 Protein of unknown function (DUF3078) [Solitalea canadensis DSM 3403]
MRKPTVLLTIVLLFCLKAFSQDVDSTRKWTLGGTNTFQFSQASFSNWAAGGQNSLTFITAFKAFAKRNTPKNDWETIFDAAFGTQRLEDNDYRKTEDRFELNSKYGIKASDKLYATFLMSLRSQFLVGYKFAADGSSTKVSNFLAPGYLTASFGLDYKPYQGLSLYISPFGSRTTMVFDQDLADQGAYGVKPADTANGQILKHGSNIFQQVGLNASFRYDGKLFENVKLTTKLDLFSTYENLNAMDVYWEALFDCKINRFLTANLSTGLIYDQKVMIKKPEYVNGVLTDVSRPRVQFKEIISLGVKFSY